MMPNESSACRSEHHELCTVEWCPCRCHGRSVRLPAVPNRDLDRHRADGQRPA